MGNVLSRPSQDTDSVAWGMSSHSMTQQSSSATAADRVVANAGNTAQACGDAAAGQASLQAAARRSSDEGVSLAGTRVPIVISSNTYFAPVPQDDIPYWGTYEFPSHLIVECAQMLHPQRSIMVPITNAVAAECVGFVQRRRVQDCFDTKRCCNSEGLLQAKDKFLKQQQWERRGETNRFLAKQACALRSQYTSYEYSAGDAEVLIEWTIQSLFVKRARGYRFVYLFAALSNIGAICDVGRIVPDSYCDRMRLRASIICQRSESCCCVCSKVTRSRCESCRHVFYCSPTCQAKDWPFHKLECSPTEKVEQLAGRFRRIL